MSSEFPHFNWSIRRNGRECARARTRLEADRIVRQLKKIYRTAEFTVIYQGANISHCGG